MKDTIKENIKGIDICKYIDHTILKPTFTEEELKKILDETIHYQFASACIPPCSVSYAKEYVQNKSKICTVIGFPLGYQTTECKKYETKQALEQGADEIDVVINLHLVKSKKFDLLSKEIYELKEICKDNILKVIVETCYLTEKEKIELCKIVTNEGADFIKTSTGFGTGGATFDDIALMKQYIGKNVQMKASGGIRSLEEVNAYIEKGVTRIGTSSILAMLGEK